MNKWQKSITGALGIVLISLGPVALAESPAKDGERKGWSKSHHKVEKTLSGKRGEHVLGRLADELQLTDEQRQALRQEQLASRDDNRVQPQELREAHKALRQARSQGADEAELAVLQDRLHQLRLEHQAARAESRERFLAILTPEQRTQLDTLREEHKGLREERKERSERRHSRPQV